MTTKELLLQEIELMSEKQLSEMLILAQKIRQKSSDKLSKLMDEISEKAQARGLNPEILVDILNEELENRRQEASLKLSATMDRASEEAEGNRFTPEILKEITTEQIIDLANSSSAFNFLNNEPDIYTLEDGEAI